MKASKACLTGVLEWAKQRNRLRSPSEQARALKEPGNEQASTQSRTEKAMTDRTPQHWLAKHRGFMLACVAVAIFGWMFRYEVLVVGTSRAPIVRLDRWTGYLYEFNTIEGWVRFDAVTPVVLIEKPAAKE